MTMHTAWLILFIIALVGAVVFLGLLFAGYVSEKWMVHRKVYAIMLAIFCALTIWFNREYQVTMPKSSMSASQQAAMSDTKQNAFDKHMAPLPQKK